MTAWALTDDFSSGKVELVAEGGRLPRKLRFPQASPHLDSIRQLKGSSKSGGPTQQELLALGTVINDRFRILGICGQGGMGIVYKARDIRTQHTVALKMLRKDLCTDEQVFRRFQKEAQAASLLSHPNIVAIHDFGMPSGSQAFLAMDFLQGTSLHRILSEDKWLNRDRFKNVFAQACHALGHAHKNGVVHRDVKPSNLLLVDKQNNPEFLVIVDFGLVKLMSMLDDQRVTTTNTLVGSPLYMSPEQCKHMPVDHRSDIYALGCTMYEALSGFPPHLGDTPLETFCKHIAEEPASLRDRNPYIDAPAALEAVVMKALAKDPSKRQQSMEELQADIEQALRKPDAISVSLNNIKAQARPAQTAQKSERKFGALPLAKHWLFGPTALVFALLFLALGLIVSSAIQSESSDGSLDRSEIRSVLMAPHAVPVETPAQPLPRIELLSSPTVSVPKVMPAAPRKPKRSAKKAIAGRAPYRHYTYYWYSRRYF